MDRARNSDHFTFLKLENPSIRSGATAFLSWVIFDPKKFLGQKIETFLKKIWPIFGQKIFFFENIFNFRTAGRIFKLQKAKRLKISPEIH